MGESIELQSSYFIEQYINNSNSKLIGVTGNAGSGKSTLSTLLSNSTNSIKYSSDYKFIGDSEFRKVLLEKKAENDFDSYIDVCNQYNWWDWESITQDLKSLKNNVKISLDKKYNRETGHNEDGLTLDPTNKKIIYEGAILGSNQILNLLDEIIFLNIPKDVRFKRLLDKDIKRRSFNEILARFLITEYSENKHYMLLFKYYKHKIKVIDINYDFVGIDESIFNDKQYIPFPIKN